MTFLENYDIIIIVNEERKKKTMRIWFVNFVDDLDHAYTSPEKAYQAAWDWLIKEGYNPEDEECGFFNELKETYENTRHSGFEVDEVLYCYEVEVD